MNFYQQYIIYWNMENLRSSGNSIINNESIIKGIFLLLLATSGNFIGSTLGCKQQYHMTNNVYLRQLIVLMIIYFTINFSSTGNPHPFETMKQALIIWFGFMLFTKMTLGMTILSLGLLTAFYVLTNYKGYVEDNYDGYIAVQKKDRIEKAKRMIVYCLVFSIVIGFSMYFMEKREEYGHKFSPIVFIFGVPKCNSLKLWGL